MGWNRRSFTYDGEGFRRLVVATLDDLLLIANRTLTAAGEDLIIYKTLAGRPRDLTDIEEAVRFQAAAGKAIDWRYVEDECRLWDALDILNQARARSDA